MLFCSSGYVGHK